MAPAPRWRWRKAARASRRSRWSRIARNPFAPETTIAFALGRASRTAVRIFDVVGRQVAVLFDQNAGPGMHRVTWDGRSQEGNRLPSGIYMYEVRTETAVRRGRMVMLH
ncbi:MAG: T9SS type A sorting domain-containing protein [Candidatus Eisenbacteria bacterium]|nr:T9SS type A sorting domain-containing protein [Candidatus Eisenbacteria bacterium]